jgi:hypothetical protein
VLKSLLNLGNADHDIDTVTDTILLALGKLESYNRYLPETNSFAVNGRQRADQTTVDVTNNPQSKLPLSSGKRITVLG